MYNRWALICLLSNEIDVIYITISLAILIVWIFNSWKDVSCEREYMLKRLLSNRVYPFIIIIAVFLIQLANSEQWLTCERERERERERFLQSLFIKYWMKISQPIMKRYRFVSINPCRYKSEVNRVILFIMNNRNRWSIELGASDFYFCRMQVLLSLERIRVYERKVTFYRRSKIDAAPRRCIAPSLPGVHTTNII